MHTLLVLVPLLNFPLILFMQQSNCTPYGPPSPNQASYHWNAAGSAPRPLKLPRYGLLFRDLADRWNLDSALGAIQPHPNRKMRATSRRGFAASRHRVPSLP